MTSSGYDDIGKILDSMGVAFEPFPGTYDCDLLFVNCGTGEHPSPDELRSFVHAGGCLYASDLTSSLIMSAFPGSFRFAGNGSPGQVAANVVDDELRQVVGDKTDIHFDLSGWAVLEGCQGETLVEAPGAPRTPGARGGTVADPARLLGAFIHGAAWSYDCDVHGSCPANDTDTDVPLLHLPLVVLTDRNCVSGCDAFSGAVKDLRLGTLIGTRTAGIVSGPADAYLLNDASLLALPAWHELSAHHELINGIGVAPDYYLPVTAHDLSTGHDPDITKALTLLGG